MSRLMIRNDSKKVIAVVWSGQVLALQSSCEVGLGAGNLPIAIYLIRGNKLYHLESFSEPFSLIIISDSLIEHEVLVGTIK